jgi:aminoglycoside 2'-N-acetyltransferase I
VRALLEGVFAGDFSAHDWEHALGGVHALAWEDGALVGHASVVQRRLLHGGRALRAGYVEGVGVRADRQRAGIGGVLMDAIERVIRGAYELGALGATEAAEPLYGGRGWQRWRGPTSALTPDGVAPSDEDSIWVLPVSAPLDLDGELTCDWRDGDVW